MSIEGSREREDQILEDQLAAGEITDDEYSDAIQQLDHDQREYESDINFNRYR